MALADRFFDVLLKNVVLLICLLPLVGAVLALLSARWGAAHVRSTALTNSLLTLALSLLMAASYGDRPTGDGPPTDDVQMVSAFGWIGPSPLSANEPAAEDAVRSGRMRDRGNSLLSHIQIHFAVGVDGLSLWPIVLCSLLAVAAIVCGPVDDDRHPAPFYALLLIEQSVLAGLFAALDVVLFCVCLQVSLLPLFFLIGMWGGYERKPAARWFLLFNLAGSLLATVGLVALVLLSQADLAPPLTFGIPHLSGESPHLTGMLAASDWSRIAWLMLCLLGLGLAFRLAAFPCHAWFVPAATEAPLSARLLLLPLFPLIGLYGLARFVVPLLAAAGSPWMETLQTAAIGGAIYFALLAWAEPERRRLAPAAMLSGIHFALAGLLSLTRAGITGSLLYAMGLALAVACLLVAGDRDERGRSGVSRRPAHDGSGWHTACGLLVVGIPGSAGFAGGLLMLLGLFEVNRLAAAGAVLAWCLLAAAVASATWQEKEEGESAEHRSDGAPAVRGQRVLLVLLIAAIVATGIAPRLVTSRMGSSVTRLADTSQAETSQ